MRIGASTAKPRGPCDFEPPKWKSQVHNEQDLKRKKCRRMNNNFLAVREIVIKIKCFKIQESYQEY